jgi:hypothetical protein
LLYKTLPKSTEIGYNQHAIGAGRTKAAKPRKGVRLPMIETLTMLLVVFAAMNFVVGLILLVVTIIDVIKRK